MTDKAFRLVRVNAPSRHSPDLRRRARRDNWQDGHDRPIGQASVNNGTPTRPKSTTAGSPTSFPAHSSTIAQANSRLTHPQSVSP